MTTPKAIKPEPELPLKKACEKLVADTAGTASWKLYTATATKPDIAQIKAHLWSTPEGQALADLSRCPWAAKPKSEALALIAGNPEAKARYAEGVRVLRQGFPLA